jgi:UDP:flavonoid glycosyltransferase YjiC (YdhE family)
MIGLLCITHAGLNTVLESLANGVPLVALPVTNDQPGVAVRIRAKGVGDFLTASELSAERLKGLIQRVLSDPRYRENARSIARAIAKTNGMTSAAEQIESAFSKVPAEILVRPESVQTPALRAIAPSLRRTSLRTHII